MSDAEVTEWLKLFQVGGNAGIIVLAVIAVRVAAAFLKALTGIVDTMNANHAKVIQGQEDIKRAIVSIRPQTEEIFRQRGAG